MTLVLAERPGLLPYRNDLTFKPYVYRGTGTDVLTPELDDEPAEQPAPGEPCWCGGGMRGYRKHLAERTDPCQASRDDVNLYMRSRRRARKPHKVHQAVDGKPRCGGKSTELAAADDQVTCKTCLNFMHGTHVNPPSSKGRVRADPEPCGTHAAYQRHRRREGKPVRCKECLAGERRRSQDRAEAS